MTRLPFALTLIATTGREHVAYLRRHLRAAHALLAPSLAELSIALVGDKRMSNLHVQFLNVAGPTDVLTFPLEVDRRGRVTAGEIVVCVPEAKRRAAGHGVTVRQEVLLYAVHGLLHLCGYDDLTPAGFRRMHRKEDDLLARLGVGPVFGSVRGLAHAPGAG